jgi:hypothetical protein
LLYPTLCSPYRRIRSAIYAAFQRDILPARVTTHEQAEVLIALDSSVDRADREWRQYLVATIRDFVIWGAPPVGRLDKDKAEWLATALSSSSRKTARAIMRQTVREAPRVD